MSRSFSSKRHEVGSARPRNVDALNIRAVAWDLDGTLVDTERGYFRAWEQVYRHHDIPLTRQLWNQMMTADTDPAVMLGESWGVHVSASDQRFINRMVTREIRSSGPMPGAIDRLRECRDRGVVNCIVTNGSRRWVDTVLPRSLHRMVDHVFTIDDFGIGKPSPIGHLSACQALGLQAHQMLGVEDSTRGIMAVCSAGMAGVLVSKDVKHPSVPRYSSLTALDLDVMDAHVAEFQGFVTNLRSSAATPPLPRFPAYQAGFAL